MRGARRRSGGIRRLAGESPVCTGWIFLLAGIAVLVAGCGEKGKHAPDSADRPLLRGVEVVEAVGGSRERFIEAAGTVRAETIAVVAAQVMGRITSLPVAAGSRVEKGALLATIDDTQIRAQLAAAGALVTEAEAGLKEVEGAIAQAEASKSLAEKTYERFRMLHEEKVVTPQEFDEVEVKRTVAVKDYERALDKRAQVAAKITQAKAQEDAARAMLSYTRVTAPFPGVVTGKKADVGSMAAPGVPILVMEDTRRYRIEASVPEAYLGVFKVGSRVRVVLGTPPGQETPGTISEVVPQVDPESRTFIAKVDLPEGGQRFRTGMFGRVLFPTGKENMLVVPQKAITHVGGYEALFTVTADNVAHLVMVTTGNAFGDEVEILSGIEPGTHVAVSPLEKLVDGARVEVRK
ncbi:MAG: efflux RND transporter periplasmic adaptor subunit [Candidatus Deferrimicrobiaceae bacterium]